MQNSNKDEYCIVEPNITSHSIYKLTEYKEAINKSDISVFLVAHREFLGLEIKEEKIVMDFSGVNKK